MRGCLSLNSKLENNLAERGRVARITRRAHNPEIGGSNPPPAILLYHDGVDKQKYIRAGVIGKIE